VSAASKYLTNAHRLLAKSTSPSERPLVNLKSSNLCKSHATSANNSQERAPLRPAKTISTAILQNSPEKSAGGLKAQKIGAGGISSVLLTSMFQQHTSMLKKTITDMVKEDSQRKDNTSNQRGGGKKKSNHSCSSG